MFDSIKNAVGQALGGNLDPQSLGAAVSAHAATLSDGQLKDHLQTLGDTLQQAGQSDLAQQAKTLVGQIQANPGQARDTIVSFVQSNPQLLEHFSPEFAQGILSKLGA